MGNNTIKKTIVIRKGKASNPKNYDAYLDKKGSWVIFNGTKWETQPRKKRTILSFYLEETSIYSN